MTGCGTDGGCKNTGGSWEVSGGSDEVEGGGYLPSFGKAKQLRSEKDGIVRSGWCVGSLLSR
jgi:hypothetical protein